MMNQIAQSRMPISAETLALFCRKWGIQKLELFGSVLRDDYRPDSDIDLLYTPASHSRWGLGFVTLHAELEGLLGKRVDLVAREAVERSRNPIRREAILSSAQVLYEA
jgi:predicted nucleotidyltransferase